MTDAFYNRTAWRNFRKAYLQRHPLCAVPGCGRLANHLDHKIRRPIGPDFPSDDGLDGLCAAHHNRKSRVHDQTRKTGVYHHELHGCSADGVPLSQDHHWHRSK
jgi:hypothetical protein